MSTTIWLVKAGDGGYDDYSDWVVKACSTEAAANAYILYLKACEDKHNSLVPALTEFSNQWDQINKWDKDSDMSHSHFIDFVRVDARREFIKTLWPDATEYALDEMVYPYRTHEHKRSFFTETTELD